MNTGAKHTFGDDAPKENPWEQDRLGFAPFAKRLAAVIRSLLAPTGYVIGLHGPWGSGKSTAINFVLEYLKKHNEENKTDQIIHIDFRPWLIAGHQDLIAAFFKLLAEELGPKETWPKRKLRGLLSRIQGTTDNLVDAAGKLAIAVVPGVGTAAGIGILVAKKSVNAAVAKFLEEPSVQRSYEDLRGQLTRSGKRFLVTIDDIDRLDPPNIREIMQMVKSIGRLPRIVYLLSYDRQIVWNALDEAVTASGPHYAEKIVQQEVELPVPARRSLMSMLNDELAFILAETPETVRWQYLVRDGLHRWVASPRDVVRLSNAMKFAWPAIEGELDPQDLLAMEGLRLFDPEVFGWIRDNRDFLFHEGRYLFGDRRETDLRVRSLKERLVEDAAEPLITILSALFPQRAEAFGEHVVASREAHPDTRRRRGIGTEGGYDTYFRLFPSPDAMPRSVVKALVASKSADEFERVIRAYLHAPDGTGPALVSDLLDELRFQFTGATPHQPNSGQIEALFRVGRDIILIEWGGAFSPSARTQLWWLLHAMLEALGLAKAEEILTSVFKKPFPTEVISEVFVRLERAAGRIPSEDPERLPVSTERLNELGQMLLVRIHAEASDGSLAASVVYYSILDAWTALAGKAPVKAWLDEGIQRNADFMDKACRCFIGYSLGVKKVYSMRQRPDPELFELNLLVSAGRAHLAQGGLSEDSRDLLMVVVQASAAFL